MKIHYCIKSIVLVFLSLLYSFAEADEINEECAVELGRIQFSASFAATDDDSVDDICTEAYNKEVCDETKYDVLQKACDEEDGQFVFLTGTSTCTDEGEAEPFVYERKVFHCYGKSCTAADVAVLEMEFVEDLQSRSEGTFVKAHDECTTVITERSDKPARSGNAVESLQVTFASLMLVAVALLG